MANDLFTQGKEDMVTKQIDWLNDDIKVLLLDSGAHTVDLVNDRNLSDITGGAIIATSANLTGKSVSGGVLDANDITFSAVSGATIEEVLIYKDTGTPSTSSMLVRVDTATGLPVTPTGGDISITWDTGANKILAL